MSAIHALDNTFGDCKEEVHLSKGAAYDKALPVPNLALKASATASSIYDRTYLPQFACDGSFVSGGWSSKGTPGETPWLQLDLGAAHALARVEVVLRQDIDQPVTRRNFQVLASTTPDFADPIVLGSQGETALAHRATWSADLTVKTPFRYLRVVKTAPEYFFVAEVRAFANEARQEKPK